MKDKPQTTEQPMKIHFSDLDKSEQKKLVRLLEDELKAAIEREIINARPSHIRI